jgi:hypothetical protein
MRPIPGTQSQGKAASMQPLGKTKNKKGHHLNTPPLWEIYAVVGGITIAVSLSIASEK